MVASIIAATMLLSGVAAPESRNVCIAGAWLPLRQGERAQHWIGADQGGYVIARPDGKMWRLGIGGFGTPLGPRGKGLGRIVLRLPGHVVHEVKGASGARSMGYLLLATRKLPGGVSETVVDTDSILIGGSALTGGSSDLPFLRRFIFGERAMKMCGKISAR